KVSAKRNNTRWARMPSNYSHKRPLQGMPSPGNRLLLGQDNNHVLSNYCCTAELRLQVARKTQHPRLSIRHGAQHWGHSLNIELQNEIHKPVTFVGCAV